jgi:prevent-host-death family protein
MAMAILALVKTIAAGKFKNVCLKTLDDVAETRTTIVITKRGRPIAKLVPYVEPGKRKSLAGSVLTEAGDPFSTGEAWDADAS